MATIPRHPAANPVIDPGVYEATVAGLVTDTLRNDDSKSYVRIVLFLPGPGVYLATNIYLDNGIAMQKAAQRLWHFCRVVGFQPYDVTDRPEAFVGRRLRVAVFTNQPEHSGQARAYSEVGRFLVTDLDEGEHEISQGQFESDLPVASW